MSIMAKETVLAWRILPCVFMLAACGQALRAVDDDHPIRYAETKENFFNDYDEETVFPVHLPSKSFELITSSESRIRSKRSSGMDTDFIANSHDSHSRKATLKEFVFKGFEEYFHMQLKPEQHLLAPGFKVYHLKNGVQQKVEETPKDYQSCFYSGKLRHQSRSKLALNLCGGMTGLIKTETADYLIEPLHDGYSDGNATSRPHILKRRSVENPPKRKRDYQQDLQTHFCGKKRRYMPHKPRRKDHWLPGEFPATQNIKPPPSLNRTKRWAPGREHRRPQKPGRKRSVETLVVADREMVRKHGSENVTTYLLTVFNMVSMLYQDSSIDNNVTVILVGLVLLEGDEPGLTLSHNAESSLSSFCQWQSTIHTSGGRQHDHAVLVTGLDICSWKNEPCDTLGYAPISGMCSKYRSCTLNEDSGLALAFTVAHEIGHNFGMLHDGQGSSLCRKGRGTIMSASLSGLDTSVLWSECSKRDLSDFLESSRSQCLRNEPNSPGELQFPNHLPGQLYDADMQCRLQFGNKSKLCTHYTRKNEVCRSLWCQRNGRECETKFLPAAEGTPCGKNKWCRKGSCIDRDSENLRVVDGGWSEFTAWSNCSGTCNGGLMVRERFCDSPEPQNGGQYCKGEEKEYRVCGTTPCEEHSPEYPADQCSTFNKRTVKGTLYKWKPYGKDLGALSRCRIYCVPDKVDLYLVLSTKLQDGTSCNGNFSGVCIDGECRSVGCDGKVDSSIHPDHCGVCNGDNSTCKTIRGTFHATNLTAGYHEVVRVPPGSRHLHISESQESAPYLALKDGSGHRRLNREWPADWPGRYEAAGTLFSYRRWPGKPESLVAKGPTTDELIVEVLLREEEESVVNYKFVISTKDAEWKYINSSCSLSCGSGVLTASPTCVDSMGETVDEINCDKTTKQKPLAFPCYEAPCPARWEVGEWSECNADSCNPAWQYRPVQCIVGTKEVSKSLCSEQVAPEHTRKCMKEECGYRWFAGPWSKCRGFCPNGFQIRSVTCRQSANGTAESFSHCDQSSQPPHMRKCKSSNCLNEQKNPEAAWTTGPWSECNVKCGQGNQTRNVSCIRKTSINSQTSTVCDSSQKPIHRKNCFITECNEAQTVECSNHYEWCPISTNKRLCTLKFYATNCCKTCRTMS